jgi:hypothetical protein
MSQSSGLSLEDKMALRELVERYALAADTRNPDMFGSCFTKDGVNRTPKVPESLGPTLERSGRDEIGQSILGLKRYFATMHAVVGQVIDDTDPERPTGVVACLANHVTHLNGELTNHAWSLHYHDNYVREDGAWRIAKRELYCDWIEQRPVRFLREGLDAQQ